MIKFNWLVFGTLLIFWTCGAYKILVVFPIPSKSHGILGDAVVKYLLEAGHEVTYVTPFPKNDSSQNLHNVDVSASEKFFNGNTIDIKAIMNNTLKINDVRVALNLAVEFGEVTITNENVQRLLKEPNQQFDLVLAEWLFTEIYSGFAAIFDCPLIWFSTIEPHGIILNLIDERLNPAYNTDHFNAYPLPFTFSQRVGELWRQIKWWYYINFNFFYRQEKVYETYMAPVLRARGKAVPRFKDLVYNASLVLGNSHVSLGQAIRLPQNYKAVGGFHVESAIKSVPHHLQKIMNNSKNGVIYFSMGSNLRSVNLPDELKRNLLKVFGELNQTVLWKYEEQLPNVPDNLHILNWAPQQSILSHPNSILFITHGGFLSNIEAVHYGVPIIGIPVFSDQFRNVDTAVIKGYGIKVDLLSTMADDIKVAIMKMINNSSYKKKIKEISAVYHDRLVTPGVELVYWVEHVVRTRGASQLRSPAFHVSWYQKIYLDLFAVILTIALVLYTLLKRLYCNIVIKSKNNKLD